MGGVANGRLVGNAVGGDEDKRVIGLKDLSDGLALLDWVSGQKKCIDLGLICQRGSKEVCV